MNIKMSMAKYGLDKMVDQIYEDPGHALPKVMDWAEKFAGDSYQGQIGTIKKIVNNPEDPY